MRLDEYPNLLVVDRLVRPLDLSIEKVRETQTHIDKSLPDVLLHGAFVMVVSSMEVALSDVLRYFLSHFPQKLEKEELRYSKEEFFENYFRLIKATVDRFVMSLSYKSFRDFLDWFLKALSFDSDPSANQDAENLLQEIRATRNLLLHNNLVVNDFYLEQSGAKARAIDKGTRLKVDLPYVLESMNTISDFELRLREAISNKYKSYTTMSANKRLWEFLFSSPVMPFDDFWEYDEAKDRILASKRGKYEGGLSSTEILRLGLWRAHFSGNAEYLKNFHMRSFDRRNQEKVLFFLSIAPDFSFE